MTEEYLNKFNRSDYQIDNFTEFIEDIGFTFKCPAIHIAGTNGKGSVAHYLYSIYKLTGLKVALYTSPFEKEINEMIIVNDKQISDKEFESYFKKYEKQLKKHDLSKFEIETFIALSYFNDQNVDLAIIECGMGGKEDATNIITPVLSIITTVSLEHTEQLGRTTSEIALAKAGIVKEEVPLIIGDISENDVNVISDVCRKNKSKLITTTRYSFETLTDDGYTFTCLPYRDIKISTPAIYSVEDACIAIEAVKALQDQFPVTDEQLYEGLKESTVSLRMEIVHENPLVIIDGAHNVDGIKKLCNSVEKYAKGRPIHVIFACFRDKNVSEMLTNLNYISTDISTTTFDHPRARQEDEFFLYSDVYPFYEDYKSLITSKMEEYPDDVILICGSLAFSALVKEMFK